MFGYIVKLCSIEKQHLLKYVHIYYANDCHVQKCKRDRSSQFFNGWPIKFECVSSLADKKKNISTHVLQTMKWTLTLQCRSHLVCHTWFFTPNSKSSKIKIFFFFLHSLILLTYFNFFRPSHLSHSLLTFFLFLLFYYIVLNN